MTARPNKYITEYIFVCLEDICRYFILLKCIFVLIRSQVCSCWGHSTLMQASIAWLPKPVWLPHEKKEQTVLFLFCHLHDDAFKYKFKPSLSHMPCCHWQYRSKGWIEHKNVGKWRFSALSGSPSALYPCWHWAPAQPLAHSYVHSCTNTSCMTNIIVTLQAKADVQLHTWKKAFKKRKYYLQFKLKCL